MLPNKTRTISYQKVTLPDINQQISVRRYLTSEVKEFLHNINGKEDKYNLLEETTKMVKNCIAKEDLAIFEKITQTDFVHLCLFLRSISQDSQIEYPHKCPFCEFGFPEFKVDFSKNEVVKTTIKETSEVTLSDNTIVYFKKAPFLKEKEIIKKYGEDLTYIAYEKLKVSISKIKDGETIYDDFSDKELEEYLNNLEIADYMKLLREVATNNSTIKISDNVKCISCGKEYVLEVDDMSFFV